MRARRRPTSGAAAAAQQAMDHARVYELSTDQPLSPPDVLLGNWVTRAGPIRQPESLSAADQESLRRLEFRPVFVGLERRFVTAVIGEDPVAVRELTSRERQRTEHVRTDGAGGWLVRVGEGIVLQ